MRKIALIWWRKLIPRGQAKSRSVCRILWICAPCENKYLVEDYYLQITIGSLEDYEILDTIVNDLNPSFKNIGIEKSFIEADGWTPLHFVANTRSIEIHNQ